MRKLMTFGLGLGLVGAMALTACGSDDKSDSAATTAASSATTAASSATTSGADSGSTTEPTFTGEDSEDFCAYFKQVSESDIGSATDTPAEAEKSFDEVSDALAQLVDKASDEIKPDVQTYQTAFGKVKDIAAKYNYDLGDKNPQASTEAAAVLSDPATVQAMARLTAYSEKVCGVNDGGDDTSSTTTG